MVATILASIIVTMPVPGALIKRLSEIPELRAWPQKMLWAYTRFAIGGPAALLCDTANEDALVEALRAIQESGAPHVVIGGGSNLIVADEGFDGVALRYSGSQISRDGDVLHVQAGAVLQDAVDESISFGLQGLETMTGIPGFVGGAIYGNAGAYGKSIHEITEEVRFTESGAIHVFNNRQCGFGYRDSIFKQDKRRVILSTTLRLSEGNAAELALSAHEIRSTRDEKYPPTMKCAGSIFKNLFYAELPGPVQEQLPARVIRDGKVPSAWFLEQVGAKGLRRGDIQVAGYHANLIYNDGAGTAKDLVWVIEELKRRVFDRFQFAIEEEVQYVGLFAAGQ